MKPLNVTIFYTVLSDIKGIKVQNIVNCSAVNVIYIYVYVMHSVMLKTLSVT